MAEDILKMRDIPQFNSIENRRTLRETFKVPVRLEVIESDKTSTKFFLGYTSDISAHGVGVSLPSNARIKEGAELIINIDGNTASQSRKVPARLLWHSNSQCGLSFLKELDDIHALLKNIPPTLELQLPWLKKFYPYIGDEDVDTRVYEYFPYADKFITEFRKTREFTMQLKRGLNPEGAQSYLYAQYSVADSELNRLAILTAHRAFKEYSKFSIQRRRKILDDVRDLLLKEKESLIELMIIEGHPRKLAEWEYEGMVSTITSKSLDYFQSELLQTTGHYGAETVLQVRRPYGVICISTPRNASSIGFMAGLALLAGNTLIVKPPMQMPICPMYMWRNIFGKALRANGAPKGTINVLVGNSKQFLEEWLESPLVKCVIYFGDSDNGLEIGKKIFEKGKKPILELSGNDILAVWKDAPIELATDSLLDCFMGSMQICMVPKKALVHEDIYPQFIKLFLQKVQKLKVGLPSDPDTILSPVGKIQKFFDFLNDAIENGAELLTGGYRMNHLGDKDPDGLFIAPTVVEVPIERANMMKCLREENFFPLLPVIRVRGRGLNPKERDNSIFNDMSNILTANEYGLRISIWVRDPIYLRRFIDEIHHSGLLRINSKHIGFSHGLSVNGGVGKSGGPFGEMNHIWQKTSHLQGVSVTNLDVKER